MKQKEKRNLAKEIWVWSLILFSFSFKLMFLRYNTWERAIKIVNWLDQNLLYLIIYITYFIKNNTFRIRNFFHFIYIYRIIMTRKFGKHLHAKHWTVVSTILGLISSAYCDLHHWRSNQQPQKAEAKTLPLGHRSISQINGAKLTSHGDNAQPLK